MEAPVGAAALRVLRRALQRRDPPDLDMRDPVDARVGDEHDGHGNVEADEGWGDGVLAAQARVAAVRVGRVGLCGARVGFVPVQLHGDERDEHRQRPHRADHHEGDARRHLALVAERAADGPVAVHADDAQVQDGRGGAHDVKRHPDVAERAERPEPGHLRRRLPRHHEHGHQQVRHGQRRDEDVRDFGAQVAEAQHGGAHQSVPEQRPEDQRAQQGAGQRARQRLPRLGSVAHAGSQRSRGAIGCVRSRRLRYRGAPHDWGANPTPNESGALQTIQCLRAAAVWTLWARGSCAWLFWARERERERERQRERERESLDMHWMNKRTLPHIYMIVTLLIVNSLMCATQ